jgi:hypothetical protein
MANVVALNTANAKSGTGKSFTRNAKSFAISVPLISAIKQLWPRKTSQIVSHLTGCDERTVKFWLAGETRMSVESVSALLRTEEGFEILSAIMGDQKPKWWVAMKAAMNVRRSREALEREKRRHAELQHELALMTEQNF